MPDVAFYHLTRTDLAHALPPLLARTLATGQRAVVRCGTAESLVALDHALWESNEFDWLPHGTEADGDPDLQLIWLTIDDMAPNGARFLFLVDGADSAHKESYLRVFDLFDGNDAEAVSAARLRWKAAKASGHTLTYWQQVANRWEKKPG
jgi:DNA polymerase III subunit chi